MIGAIFMIVADILSRIIISGQVLPIGVITALFGAPAFAPSARTKKGVVMIAFGCNVGWSAGNVEILRNVSLNVAEGEFCWHHRAERIGKTSFLSHFPA